MNQQFILLAKRIWHELRTLLRKLEEQVESLAENSEHNQRPIEPQPSPIVRAEIQIPEKVVEQYETHQKKSGRLQWGTFWLTFGTLIAIGLAAVFTYKTLDVQRKTERPYVGVIPETVTIEPQTRSSESPKTPGEMPFTINWTLKNSGNSAALWVYSDVIPIWEWRWKEFKKEQDAKCTETERYEMGKDHQGRYLMPGFGPTMFPQAMLQRSRHVVGVGKPLPDDQRFLRLWLAGCVVYRDQENQVHHTRWCAESKIINTPEEIKAFLEGNVGGFEFCNMGQAAD